MCGHHPTFVRAICFSLLLTCPLLASPGAAGRLTQEKRTGRPPAAAATRERLAVRVDRFWKAWQMRNLHQVYLLFAPSYRKDTTETAFYEITRGMLDITPVSYTIDRIDIGGNTRRATVVLDAKSIVAPLGEVPNKLVMHWVFEQGDWYREMTPQEVIPVPKSPGGP